jgi:hypothetical protein
MRLLLFVLVLGLGGCPTPGKPVETGDTSGATECDDPCGCDTGGWGDSEDGDGYRACEGDCDDSNADINPGAEEICDGIDNNCNELIDEGVETTVYADADGDGYGDPTVTEEACEPDDGHVSNAEDCDDTDATAYPDAPEVCDAIDNDCDGDVDEGVLVTRYLDADGDGFGDPDVALDTCDDPGGYVLDATDCDDADAGVFPGAPELCNDADDDCDGEIDEDLEILTWFPDTDGDGEGTERGYVETCDGPPVGYVDNAVDCDDDDGGIYTTAAEICDGVDQDCDGNPDDGIPLLTWYQDIDGDGYGDPVFPSFACSAPRGTVADGTDCADADPTIHPGATETCDGIDQDCDGAVDNGGVCG